MEGDSSNAGVEHVVICQCTDAKRDEPAPAGEIYDESDYFRKQRDYAKAVADRWFIQSAKHGLLAPSMEIEPYDMRPKDIDNVDAWAEEIAGLLAEEVPTEATVEVLGGAAYADPLTPALERRGFEVLEPLRGQRIGNRKRSLKQMANRRLEGFA